jgi:AraC family transcriptional regulator, positive regulator of tynA and feaB
MNSLKLSTRALPQQDRAVLWRKFISEMIRNVVVDKLSEQNFAADITARKHGSVSCASFWSMPHQVKGVKESISNWGSSGYLVSWQTEGRANISIDGNELVLQPGQVAVIDGRRPMRVDFPSEVRRIVANLPAVVVEKKIPSLRNSHTLVLSPKGAFGSVLHTYLAELACEDAQIDGSDMELISDNICNLLKICTDKTSAVTLNSRGLQLQAIINIIQRNCLDSTLSLSSISRHLAMSPRLVQKILNESQLTFTEVVMNERLDHAVRWLVTSQDQISSIAYSCGFNDISHFNHVFKRRFGEAPSTFRARNFSHSASLH